MFNTYGKLGSGQLLQSYGFVEETPNPYDMVGTCIFSNSFYIYLTKHCKFGIKISITLSVFACSG